MKTKLTLRRLDKQGSLIEKRERYTHSWTLNLIKLLHITFLKPEVAGNDATDITGNIRNLQINQAGGDSGTKVRTAQNTLRMASPGGNSYIFALPGFAIGEQTDWVTTVIVPAQDVGVVVGTGVGAESPSNIALGTKIVHGNGAGQFEYGACELSLPAFVNPNGEFAIRRFFTNNSGGGITAQEVGLYALGIRAVSAGPNQINAWLFCVARDLTGGVAVADTELLEVTYTIQITV
jgi:hypothetical protein